MSDTPAPDDRPQARKIEITGNFDGEFRISPDQIAAMNALCPGHSGTFTFTSNPKGNPPSTDRR